MINIDIRNFEENKNDMIINIKNSEFISIDCEFSNILKQNEVFPFDSLSEYYYKYRNLIKDSILLQFGFTCLSKIDINGKRKSITYCVYLFNKDDKSYNYNKCINFLSENNFDFNRLYKYGISYKKIYNEENKIITELIDQPKINNKYNGIYLYSSNIIKQEDNLLLTLYNHIENNIQENKNSLNFEIIKNDANKDFIEYIINKSEKIKYFISINKIKLTNKLGKIIFKIPKMNNFIKYNKQIINNNNINISGFEIIILNLINNKSKLIFHNCFLDLLYIYNSFIYILPNCYYDFIKKFYDYFDIIYDTKSIAMQTPKTIIKFNKTSLENLEETINKTNKIKDLLYFEDKNNDNYNNINNLLLDKNNHNAGYDSLITGYVFLALKNIYDNNSIKIQANSSYIRNNNYIFIENNKIIDNYSHNPSFINNSIIIKLKKEEDMESVINKINEKYNFNIYFFKFNNSFFLLFKFKNLNDINIDFKYTIYENRYEIYK